MTSAHVVARAKRALRVRRIGHTGTLDPMATGVLPLVVGEGTKIASLLLADDKRYMATVELGAETDTDDADGEVVRTAREQAAALEPAQIVLAAAGLKGEIEQVPPIYSALKRDGKRMYELARAGHEVELEPRPVTVYELELTRVAPPKVDIGVHCSKGTYIRALARDLGRALGVGGHLTALRRTAAGPFTLDRAIPLANLDPELAAARIVSPAQALAHLPAIHPQGDHLRRISQGLPRRAAEVAPGLEDGVLFRCLTPDDQLLAVAHVEAGEVRYKRVFPRVWPQSDKG
ncbi:MAG: tRNA pseudouridine(55) synthase TruB [Deltaproteobacteria bacterium]|nr:tRNA pseudouridine(55) synthase TruB [Deltaproteobacteria bacterium]